MRRPGQIILCILVLTSSARGQDGSTLPYVPGEVLVKFRSGVKLAQENTSLSAPGMTAGKVVEQFPSVNVVRIKLNPDDNNRAAVKKAVAKLSDLPIVEYVQPNYRYYPADTSPDDPDVGGMDYLTAVKLPAAWDVRREAREIVVAVIDSGVMLAHEDLAGNLWRNPDETPDDGQDNDGNGLVDDVHGWDFFNNDNDPTADLVPNGVGTVFGCIELEGRHFEEHGTHVAGTIGAVGNNGKGVVGAAWKVQIMPLKFLGGACGGGTTANGIRAIDYAVSKGANVINCSWGSYSFDQLLLDALTAADQADVLVVCAAGNDRQNNDLTPHYPSSYDLPNIIAVAATTRDDKFEFDDAFSNFGKESVDLAAPGVEILSTVPAGAAGQPSSGYAKLSGTSMASPVVAGVAALVRAEFPSLLDHEVRQWLMANADKLDELDGRVASGGRLNARRSLQTPNLPDALTENLPVAAAATLEKNASSAARVRAAMKSSPGAAKLLQERLKLMGVGEKSAPESVDKVPVGVLIQFEPEVARADMRKLIEKYKGYQVQTLEAVSEQRNVFELKILTSDSPETLEATLRESPDIKTVQPDKTYREN